MIDLTCWRTMVWGICSTTGWCTCGRWSKNVVHEASTSLWAWTHQSISMVWGICSLTGWWTCGRWSHTRVRSGTRKNCALTGDVPTSPTPLGTLSSAARKATLTQSLRMWKILQTLFCCRVNEDRVHETLLFDIAFQPGVSYLFFFKKQNRNDFDFKKLIWLTRPK